MRYICNSFEWERERKKGKGCAGVEHILSESESGSDKSNYLKWVKQNRKEVRSKLAEIFEMVC